MKNNNLQTKVIGSGGISRSVNCWSNIRLLDVRVPETEETTCFFLGKKRAQGIFDKYRVATGQILLLLGFWTQLRI